MPWIHAQQKILRKITQGTDLNSSDTAYRTVLEVRADISSTRYEYKKEIGFIVRIGENSSIKIPLTMLETCYGALSLHGNYDGKFFRNHYPLQAKDHPCHVHTVGQVFVVAGLAKRTGNSYRQ
ncbi:MAG: hypothetical protein H0W49_15460 [Nitrospirales bacterium]|nr:hypothetical protein [Nitrospirales bacterium]MBA3965952.1 hypothetical protein [Nitrospirales bacterium]